uniref:GDP dissociation inhibitor 1 n=1 Tax=Thraustochytrium sp. LLF1b TaxID=1112570 RepID=A0A455ZAK0_9STRA|nr:TPA_exp: GDP dissociation inhibitor 1 [Thraustochytrium sp. LLF1b]
MEEGKGAAETQPVTTGMEELSINDTPAAAPAASQADAEATPAPQDAPVEAAAPAPAAPEAPAAPAATTEAAPAPPADDGYPGEPEVPDVTLEGKTYKALADGKYDVIVLSTGLSECVLAGLLSVRGLRVLQIDRNDYYGGQCASLNLKELYEKHNKVFDPAVEAKLGGSRRYCVDTVPKLLMANGKLVKMLVQTGVTRYIDFNGIAGSYVFNTSKIYRLPVTPTEAMTSSLVSLFQKNALRKFADYMRTFKAPKRVADTLSKTEFVEAINKYYAIHNASKLSEAAGIVEQFDSKREILVTALETKYGLPVFEDATEVEFGPGSLGLKIELRKVKKGVPAAEGGPIQQVVVVSAFVPGTDGSQGPAQRSKRVAVGDIVAYINGEPVLGLTDREIQGKIVNSPRPMKITFIKPAFDVSSQKYDLQQMTMRELYKAFGIDSTTQNFIGHAMALQTDDSYLDKPAEPTVLACQLYAFSVGRYGQDSPYLYPNYGLSTIPEGFSRLSALYGGTVMLRTDVDEILRDAEGKAVGVRVGDQAASAPVIIGDASYFPPEMSRKTGQVARSVCLLKHTIKNTIGDSAQLILPAKHLVGKTNDVYVSELGPGLQVCPKGTVLAIASTQVETENPTAELRQAFELMGDIEERFDSVTTTYGPVDDGTATGCYITKSLDATSHFETAALDIMRIYRAINQKELNLNEKLVEDPSN